MIAHLPRGAHFLARFFGALHGPVGGLLRHPEMLADLPPVGTGLNAFSMAMALGTPDDSDLTMSAMILACSSHRGAFVRLGRAPRIGARPAVDVGLVDDAAQAPGATEPTLAGQSPTRS